MEGITGLVDQTHVYPDLKNYERGRRIMTTETNEVIKAALARGMKEIVVNDSHSKMNNLLIEEIHPEAKLLSGDVKPYSMVQGLDGSFEAAIFTGYHARASARGVMSHTMSFAVKSMYVNDLEVGELGLNAFMAGYYGVPLIMVSGDDGACKEAKQLIPNIVTAQVKETSSRTSALLLTPAKVSALLHEKTAEAIEGIRRIKPLIPPENPQLTIEFTNHGEAEWAALMPGTELLEGTTSVRFKAKDMPEAYRAMIVMTELAAKTTFC